MTGTRCTCGSGHATYGACLRSKNISVGQVDRTEQKQWDNEIKAYRAARAQGIQPRTTQLADVQAAVEISDRSGRAFDAGSFA